MTVQRVARFRAYCHEVCLDRGSSLNYVRFFLGGVANFLRFLTIGEGGSQVASYVIFFNLIFNKYKFYT